MAMSILLEECREKCLRYIMMMEGFGCEDRSGVTKVEPKNYFRCSFVCLRPSGAHLLDLVHGQSPLRSNPCYLNSFLGDISEMLHFEYILFFRP
jgi:hypothetical protein